MWSSFSKIFALRDLFVETRQFAQRKDAEKGIFKVVTNPKDCVAKDCTPGEN
jgi:hypothetical protein